MTPLLFVMVDAVLMADGWGMTAAEYTAPGLEHRHLGCSRPYHPPV